MAGRLGCRTERGRSGGQWWTGSRLQSAVCQSTAAQERVGHEPANLYAPPTPHHSHPGHPRASRTLRTCRTSAPLRRSRFPHLAYLPYLRTSAPLALPEPCVLAVPPHLCAARASRSSTPLVPLRTSLTSAALTPRCPRLPQPHLPHLRTSVPPAPRTSMSSAPRTSMSSAPHVPHRTCASGTPAPPAHPHLRTRASAPP